MTEIPREVVLYFWASGLHINKADKNRTSLEMRLLRSGNPTQSTLTERAA